MQFIACGCPSLSPFNSDPCMLKFVRSYGHIYVRGPTCKITSSSSSAMVEVGVSTELSVIATAHPGVSLEWWTDQYLQRCSFCPSSSNQDHSY